jgi:hypothetical protein
MSEKPATRRRFIDLGDILGLIGVVAITYGVWLIFQPAAFIVGGACLLGLSVGMAIIKVKN